MATVALSRNPIRMTNADTFTVTFDKVRIRAIYWDCSGTAAGNTASVSDNPNDPSRAAIVIWSATQSTTLVPSISLGFSGKGLQANGLQIAVPTNGVLYVYLVDSVD